MCKSMSFVVVGILAVALVGGCDRKQGARSSGKPRVALVMKSLANEFFKTMEEGARDHQKKNADQYELLANGTRDEQDVKGQSDIVEQMIAKNVDAIVIAPADSKALVPVCKKAIDRGIIVVNIDNKFDASALAEKNVKIPFVGPDNRKGAKLVGQHLASRLKAKDKVAVIEGMKGAFNAEQRRMGFEDAIKAAGLDLVASQSARWEMEPANSTVAAILTSQPELKGIFCANDSMALGAVAALKAANRTGGVMVVGYDNIGAVRQLIKDGKVLGTVDQHADQIAVYGIEYAIQILQKKGQPVDRETPVDLVTADTLK